MEFSEKLQKLRQDNDITQEQLAKQLYVSRTAISKWESGRGYPTIDSLKRISILFSISIDELLSSNELITIAETESKNKTRNMIIIIFGILDCIALLFFFLPLFAQRGGPTIITVPLLSLKNTPWYIEVPYIVYFSLTSIWGIITLALQSIQNAKWVKWVTIVSIILSIIGVFIFIETQQPYVSSLLFFILILKGILLLKR